MNLVKYLPMIMAVVGTGAVYYIATKIGEKTKKKTKQKHA